MSCRGAARAGRRRAAALLALACAAPAWPATEEENSFAAVRGLMSESRRDRRAAARRLIAARDPAIVPALVDAVFFTPKERRDDLFRVLEALTGERTTSYYEWVEYVGGREDLRPPEGYREWKASLLAWIDPRYRQVLYEGAPARIRLEEIVSGGVRLAGIPALDDPPTLPVAEARYLTPDEKVFGVLVGGEARAYPFRILSWHELVNDRVGGEPVSLSFCTLCGSGILYATRTPAGGSYTFDTSGLLYRSNKLMLDRQTWSLWSNLTGEPVVGRLARSPIELPMLPATVTTWEDWRLRHPEGTVLDLEAIRRQVDPRHGFDYRPGAADRARAGVSFPVPFANDRLPRDAEVFALRLGGAVKAYPVETALERRVINDVVGGEGLVVVGDPASGAVRAYRRGGRRFAAGERPDEVVDAEGGRWAVEESGLRPLAGPGPALERLPGHLAFWFGWYAFYPRTEVFEMAGEGS